MARHRGDHLWGKGARHFVGGYFHARKLVVEPHAELAESKRAQRRFTALDESKTLRCHFRAVRQSRSEASGGRPVPGWQTGTARKKPNFRFTQADIKKGRQDLVFRGGTMAGAKVERVVGVYTIGDSGKTSHLGQIVQHRKQFVLAEIAAVGRIRAVSRIIHFVRFDEFMPQAHLADQFLHDGATVSEGNSASRASKRFSLSSADAALPSA